MKVIILCCFIIGGLLSCKKSKETTNASILEGTWEIRAESGSIPTIQYAAGNGRVLRFLGDKYELSQNGVLVKNGTFTIVPDNGAETSTGLVITSGEFAFRIIYDGNTNTPSVFFQISSNRLTIITGFFPTDAGSRSVYERL
jgi:hypothetical protein